MTHDLSIIKRSNDFTGDYSHGDEYEEKGFVQYTSTQMVSDDGEKITAKAIIFLKADTNYDEDYPEWIIAHGSRRFIVRATQRIDDPRTGQTHHFEIGVI